MNKVAKAILIALGVILAAGAVAVLGVNLYVQSAGVQAKIQQGLGRALRTPVKIASVSFMPWYGVKIGGITAEDTSLPAGGNLLDVSSVGARIRLLQLLQRKVVIKELTVDGANASWNQDTDGKWRLPGQTPATEAQASAPAPATSTSSESPAPPAETQSQTPPPGPETAPGEEIAAQAPPVTVQHFRLRDSSFSFFDRNRKRIASLSGINVQASNPTAGEVQGTATISHVDIQELFSMENWATDFRYSPAVLSLFNTSSIVGDGIATGALNVRTGETDTPFDVDVKFSGVNVEHLLANANVNEVQASGTLAGFLQLQGNLRDSYSAQGKGRVELTNGRLAKNDLFLNLGQLLRTDRFQHVDIQEAFVDYHVAGGKILVDQLSLKSSDLSLTSQGLIEEAGWGISLKSRFTIGNDIARQIPDFLMENFGTDPATSARYIDFDVAGTINHPSTNLQNLIGRGINSKTIQKAGVSIFKNWFRRNTAPAPSQPPVAPAQQAPGPITPATSTATPGQTPAPTP